jgi:hypothetical protein
MPVFLPPLCPDCGRAPGQQHQNWCPDDGPVEGPKRAMPDKPILFSAAMIRALLDGRKTQTRRVLKPEPYEFRGEWWITDRVSGDCQLDDWVNDRIGIGPRFAIGDRLWVREAHAFDGPMVRYCATDDVHELRKKRPSIHMPRWASRLTLTVTDVRVQRVQEISEADAVAEGIIPSEEPNEMKWEHYAPHGVAFRTLWDSLNGPRGYGWDANPWVAAYTFTVARQNIDQVAK